MFLEDFTIYLFQPESGWAAILNSNPELKAIVSACEKYIPFVLIILVKSLFDHGTGIIVCCGLVLTFLHANSVLKQQVSRQARRNFGLQEEDVEKEQRETKRRRK